MKIATAIRVTVFTALLASFTLAFAQDPAPQQPPADNSKVNQRDQSPSQPTADEQKNAPNDREMARQIQSFIPVRDAKADDVAVGRRMLHDTFQPLAALSLDECFDDFPGSQVNIAPQISLRAFVEIVHEILAVDDFDGRRQHLASAIAITMR